jgi:hypothetical protein
MAGERSGVLLLSEGIARSGERDENQPDEQRSGNICARADV